MATLSGSPSVTIDDVDSYKDVEEVLASMVMARADGFRQYGHGGGEDVRHC